MAYTDRAENLDNSKLHPSPLNTLVGKLTRSSKTSTWADIILDDLSAA
jgi:hypothetical protein